MVGRLVEQQQVRTAHQRAGKVQPHAPAAGEIARPDASSSAAAETQAMQQLRGAAACRVAADHIELRVQRAEPLAVVARFRLGQCGLDRAQACVAVQHVLDGRARPRPASPAPHGRSPSRADTGTSPRIGVQFTADQREQARLAGAVGAGDADLPSRVNLQGGVLEEQPRPTAQGQIVKLQHGRIVAPRRLNSRESCRRDQQTWSVQSPLLFIQGLPILGRE